MNCLECQSWLQRRLDGDELSPTEAHEQHWSLCATCREQYTASLRLVEGLKQLPRPKLRSGFAETLTAKVLLDRRQRQAAIRRRIYVTAALAACILLTMLAGYYWMPRDQEAVVPRPPVVKNLPNKSEPAPQPPPRMVEQKDTKKSEPRNPLTSLTDRVVDTTRDHAKVVYVATNLDAVEKLPGMNDLPPLDPGVKEASQEVSEGVRTVTRNARRALDFFTRELPMPDIEAQKN
jgi:hypothetical protein